MQNISLQKQIDGCLVHSEEGARGCWQRDEQENKGTTASSNVTAAESLVAVHIYRNSSHWML